MLFLHPQTAHEFDIFFISLLFHYITGLIEGEEKKKHGLTTQYMPWQ